MNYTKSTRNGKTIYTNTSPSGARGGATVADLTRALAELTAAIKADNLTQRFTEVLKRARIRAALTRALSNLAAQEARERERDAWLQELRKRRLNGLL